MIDKTLETLIARLKKPSTPGQVMETMIRWKAAALVCTRRRGSIKVLSAAIQRRKKGKSRGSARIRAGRPPGNEPKNTRKPLPRILNLNCCQSFPCWSTHCPIALQIVSDFLHILLHCLQLLDTLENFRILIPSRKETAHL